MPRNILNVNTKTAAVAIMMGATLVSTSSWVTPQAAELQMLSSTQRSEMAMPLLGFEKLINADIAALIKFRDLSQEWKKQRGAMSSITAMSMLRPYQQIIGMGSDALPFILAELRREADDPDQWFWALSTIAEANNLAPPQIGVNIQGDYQAMAQVWLEWGESHGHDR